MYFTLLTFQAALDDVLPSSKVGRIHLRRLIATVVGANSVSSSGGPSGQPSPCRLPSGNMFMSVVGRKLLRHYYFLLLFFGAKEVCLNDFDPRGVDA